MVVRHENRPGRPGRIAKSAPHSQHICADSHGSQRRIPPAEVGGSWLAHAAGSARLGWFAMIMATGIVSVALHQVGRETLSTSLLALAVAGFAIVTVFVAARLITDASGMFAELASFGLAFSAFALVAACDVLSARLSMASYPRAAAALAAGALVSWLAIAALHSARCAHAATRPAVRDINGTWYLAAVGTQSLAIAVTFLRTTGLFPSRVFLWAGTGLWLLGTALYLAISALVALRLTRVGLKSADATAPYWVSMGAASITVVAGAQLLLAHAGTLIGTTVMKALCVAIWLVATALVPVLVVRSGWRHLRKSAPLSYRSELWMVVFPIGMYATAGIQLGRATGSAVIRSVGTVAVWPALAAWALTFVGMVISFVTAYAKSRQQPYARPHRRLNLTDVADQFPPTGLHPPAK
jgi:tellurite resistance protein TehA-like permease